MCGRYTSETEFSQIKLVFQALSADAPVWTPTFNICPSPGPGFEQPFIARSTGDDSTLRQVHCGRWWLIPQWWKKPLKQLPTGFNARAEELANKPFWRESFKTQRCLVPATGWREFVGAKAPKQPYHFRLGDGADEFRTSPATDRLLFAFAGLHSKWTDEEGTEVRSFSIITTAPSEQAEKIHNRMPLVMPRDAYRDWLQDDDGALLLMRDAQRRALELPLEIYPSNPIANGSRFEGAEAVEVYDLAAPSHQEQPRSAASRGKASVSVDSSTGRTKSQLKLKGFE